MENTVLRESMFQEADDKHGLIFPYGGRGDYFYFERHEVRAMFEELKNFIAKWDSEASQPAVENDGPSSCLFAGECIYKYGDDHCGACEFNRAVYGH